MSEILLPDKANGIGPVAVLAAETTSTLPTLPDRPGSSPLALREMDEERDGVLRDEGEGGDSCSRPEFKAADVVGSDDGKMADDPLDLDSKT